MLCKLVWRTKWQKRLNWRQKRVLLLVAAAACCCRVYGYPIRVYYLDITNTRRSQVRGHRLGTVVASINSPVHVLGFHRAFGSALPLLVDYHWMLLTHILCLVLLRTRRLV